MPVWTDVTAQENFETFDTIWDVAEERWEPVLATGTVQLQYIGRVPLSQFIGARITIRNAGSADAATVTLNDPNSFDQVATETTGTILSLGTETIELSFSERNEASIFISVSREGSSGFFQVTSIEFFIEEFPVSIPESLACALNDAESWEDFNETSPHPRPDAFLGGFWFPGGGDPEDKYLLWAGGDGLPEVLEFSVTTEIPTPGGELGDDTLWYTLDGGSTWISFVDGEASDSATVEYTTLSQTANEAESFTLEIPEGVTGVGLAIVSNNNVGGGFRQSPNGTYRLAFACPAVEPDCVINCDCTTTENSLTLEQLRRRMLIRLGFSARLAIPPPGMVDMIDEFLRSAQVKLSRRPELTHMLSRWYEWEVEEGQRLFGIMDGETGCERSIDPRQVEWMGIIDQNKVWHKLTYGIPPEFYTNLNPSLPVRYEIRQCIEIFPPPDNDDYCLVAKGNFGLLPLMAPSDRCTLPEELVFLTALADAKFHYGNQDAEVVKGEANTLLRDYVADSHMQARYVPGRGPGMPWPRPTLTEFIE